MERNPLLVALFILNPTAAIGEPMTLECPNRPNCISSQASDADRRVAPLNDGGDVNDALSRLGGIVKAMPGGAVLSVDERSLQATFTSRWFGFIDDIEFVTTGDGTIHVRSASRAGYYDFGVNRTRV